MSLPTFRELTLALHGREPYDWQTRAAAELASDGWWPALRAPTGAGKTTLVDCWLHALAVAGPDGLGRRLIWVVDRRSVVDQVHDYAARVVTTLVSPDAPPEARAVADSLREIGGDAGPRVVLWRGGLDDEGAIAMRDPLDPAAVAVVVSTVDQFGSRLLFRGYGLGTGSRALHAGIAGLDSTIVLDEAHIAEPLRRTVARVAAIQASAPQPPRPPLRLCPVSATHAAKEGFELTEDELAEPQVARRVRASKRARLVERTGRTDVAGLVRELADAGAQVVGVVMNTIADARAAFEAVATIAPEPFDDRVLLIGPVRPLDRIGDPVAVTPDRKSRVARERPFVVVATQTIEVGVDLDLDALVTACAPLDALVQRFGRLDRAGSLGVSQAVILGPPRTGCPVYGDAAATTWVWLNDAAEDDEIDAGVEAMRDTIARHGAPDAEPPVRTIRLLDAHVDALTVTDAGDEEGPAIELLLHGDTRPTADVAVAWRRLAGPSGSDPPSSDVVERELELRPIHPGEVVTISVAAMRRWLAGGTVAELSDLESVTGEEDAKPSGPRRTVLAWRLKQDGRAELIERPLAIRPTDRIVVDASAGGLDPFGWAPDSRAEVADLGSLAARGPRLVLVEKDVEDLTVITALASGELTAHRAARELAGPIRLAVHSLGVRDTKLVDAVADSLVGGRASLLEDGRVLVVGRGARTEHGGTGRSLVSLNAHQAAVANQTDATVCALGIDPQLADSLQLAARHHDEGKRDPRFQAWLRGGAAADGEALAKSAYPYDPARVRRLREAAGWPARKRHELVSAVALERACGDDRLAAWLVATHHGRNRPFCSSVDDDAQLDVVTSVDGETVIVSCSAVPEPVAQLRALVDFSRTHGPWGLAFLEAVLVCADRAVSAEESER